MNWRKKIDLYNARLLAVTASKLPDSLSVKIVQIVLNIDWRIKLDLYNAHLLAATAATAKAEKLFKIQIKQSISVGMWAEEFNC